MGKDCCADEHQTLLPIEEAISQLNSAAKTISRTQTLKLQEARSRILATDLCSPLNVPPHDNSAMDGYAVNSNDLASEGEIKRPISQRINAGATGHTPLLPGSVARIFTGAPIPPQADAVIMQEQSRREGDHVFLQGPVEQGRNIRR
ncbi:MAG: molybdopterin molybdenumtransferase MoeA, partial [Hyphomicrobiaceae bacterium]|nr:molybdopterin molybdenumtransferase MoeA [Hyphomicrobiaceae bacterium]